MIKFCENFKDYEVLKTSNGEKLERWGQVYLLRPDPQIIWNTGEDLAKFKELNARYIRSSDGGGQWQAYRSFPNEWNISFNNLKFSIKPMGFKHTGLFPEQAVNWEVMSSLIKNRLKDKKWQSENDGRGLKVLNLFAYTGGATVACAAAGAEVVHVDASSGMVQRAKENAKLSGLLSAKIRYIVDDCKKFVEREIKRGNKYDAIIMDPPSYGRGPNGEVWKIEDNIFEFVKLCENVLTNNPLFVLINSYTTGLQPTAMENILRIILKKYKGNFESYEVGIKTSEGIVLPAGCSSLFIGN